MIDALQYMKNVTTLVNAGSCCYCFGSDVRATKGGGQTPTLPYTALQIVLLAFVLLARRGETFLRGLQLPTKNTNAPAGEVPVAPVV